MQQLVVNILISAPAYALVGVGFMVILRVARFLHFAHGVVFTAGAYVLFCLKEWVGASLFLSVSISVVFCALLGGLMELVVYRPLRRRAASAQMLPLASLGIYIVLQNVISMLFGDHTRTVRSGVVEVGVSVFGARITPIQILIIAISVLLIVAVEILLAKTRLGRAIRAVANDEELARASSINSDRIFLWTFVLGSTLVGVAGMLVALDVDMTPAMGMNALMMGVVAVIVGGIGSPLGVILGALLLGMAQHLGVWVITAEWQDAIAFVILLIFLVVRPQGFLGKKLRKVTA